jgi:hypothetical protein
MGRSPPVWQKAQQVCRTKFHVGRVVLSGIGKPPQDVLPVIADRQMVMARC